MGWESFGVVIFDLGPLRQGQTRIARPKSTYNQPIEIMGWESFVWSDLTLDPSFKVKRG